MSIANILESNRKKRIRVLIAGDCMRDEYHIGEVRRMAQEATVPVLSSGEPIVVPGGAGNVARQLKYWNAEVDLIAPLDAVMEALLDDCGIGRTCYLRMDRRGHNPVKRRFLSCGQLLLRQDDEEKDYGLPDVPAMRQEVARLFGRTLKEDAPDIVVLSDYAKGLFDYQTLYSIVAACRERDIPVIADPHCSRHPHDYAGVTAFKPNEEYVRERGGKCFEFPGNLYWFKKTLSPARQMVYTRGSEPPCGFVGGREDAEDFVCQNRHNPVDAVNVVGAGDCFTAHLALGMAHGLNFKEACELAYSAGRVYVTRPYNEPVMPYECVRDMAGPTAKVVSAEEVRHYLDVRHSQGRIVFSNGRFSLPHAGHAATLQWASRQGDVLIVGVNDDISAARIKPDSFCLSLPQRLMMLTAMGCVDFVVPFSEDTPQRLIETIRPDVLVKGPDYTGESLVGADIAKEVRIAPETGLPHASDIVAAIAECSRGVNAFT